MRTSVDGDRGRQALYWTCQVVGWTANTGLSLFFTAVYLPEARQRLGRYALVYASGAVFAILCTHAYRSHLRRHGWTQLRVWRLLARVLLASLLLGLLLTALVSVVWALAFGLGPFRRFDWLPGAVLNWTWSVLLWSLLYFGEHHYGRFRRAEMERLRLEVAAKEAQLRSLVAQVNPHFFFNCLNGLRALITEDPARAQQMVTDLSSLLRYALQSGRTQTVPLRTELETVRTYLELQRLRLEERLAVEIEAAPESLAVPVPTMLVQLLVENGVTHGVEARPEGGRIQVASWLEGPALRVRVVNSGRLGGQSQSTQLGLENARERLTLLYGGAATLRLDDGDGESVVADLTVPLAPAPPGTLSGDLS